MWDKSSGGWQVDRPVWDKSSGGWPRDQVWNKSFSWMARRLSSIGQKFRRTSTRPSSLRQDFRWMARRLSSMGQEFKQADSQETILCGARVQADGQETCPAWDMSSDRCHEAIQRGTRVQVDGQETVLCGTTVQADGQETIQHKTRV